MNKAGIFRHFYQLVLLVTVCFAGVAQASAEATIAEEATAPDQMVEAVTNKLLGDIVTFRDAIDGAQSELEKEALLREFYDELQATLRPVIDFRLISKRVMGKYYKQASKEQFEMFQDVFARSLVETYGRGLLAYSSDKDVIVEPLPEEDKGKSKVIVVQKIQTAEKAIPLYYNMWKNKRGEWKVVNLILDGINMGKTFYGQFNEAAEKYQGSIDQVIENWAVSQS